jgi:hypothetical protein
MEDAYDRPAAVIAALEYRIAQRQEPPQQIERFDWIGLRHLLYDPSALRFEIFYQRPSVLPVDEGSRPCDRGKPFADLPFDLSRALRARQFEPQPTLGGRASGADLDQQLGQALSPEHLEVLRVECLLRCQSGSHSRTVDLTIKIRVNFRCSDLKILRDAWRRPLLARRTEPDARHSCMWLPSSMFNG